MNARKSPTLHGFTRKEVIAVTGIKPGNISYLDSAGIVVPQKYGNPKRPSVIYTAEQLIQIEVLEHLKNSLSPSHAKKVIQILERKNFSREVLEGRLLIVNDKLSIFRNSQEIGEIVLGLANHEKISICNVGSLSGIVTNLYRKGKKTILDFEKRCVGTPLEPFAKNN